MSRLNLFPSWPLEEDGETLLPSWNPQVRNNLWDLTAQLSFGTKSTFLDFTRMDVPSFLKVIFSLFFFSPLLLKNWLFTPLHLRLENVNLPPWSWQLRLWGAPGVCLSCGGCLIGSTYADFCGRKWWSLSLLGVLPQVPKWIIQLSHRLPEISI